MPGDKHARVKKMLVDILLFALDNPSGNLLVVSDDFDGDTVFFSVLSAFQARKYVALLGEIDWTESALQTYEGNWTKKHCSKRIDDTSVVRGSPLGIYVWLFFSFLFQFIYSIAFHNRSCCFHFRKCLCEPSQ